MSAGAGAGAGANARTLAIIDYGSGNLRSAAKAFARMAAETGVTIAIEVTRAPERVAAAERIVLPGVGAFADCMAGLSAIPGLRAALDEAVRKKGKPFLGICVGMQLMASRGLEHGTHAGLGWIAGEVVPLAPAGPALKVPHMGWNELEIVGAHPLLEGLADMPQAPHAYFVHSYHLVAKDPDVIRARTDYGGPVAAVIAKDNMAGTQFHPEKSQAVGLRLIANFLQWRP
jgi:glutamine amidotransferase